jgi:hypothetical protein
MCTHVVSATQRTQLDILCEIHRGDHLDALNSGRDEHWREGGRIAIIAVRKRNITCQAVHIFQHPADANVVPRVAILHTLPAVHLRSLHTLTAAHCTRSLL